MKQGKICMLVCVLGVLNSASNADVIIGDAEFFQLGGVPPTVLITPNAGTLGISITDAGGGDYNFDAYYIAYEYGLYSAYLGMEFTPSYAEMQTPLVSNSGRGPSLSVQTFSLNETKYFAYWTDTDWSPPDDQDYYGWVGLTYTGTELVISDSATAVGGGIIVGTYTQIPEPSSVLLLSMGAGGILFYRRAKRRQQEPLINRRCFH